MNIKERIYDHSKKSNKNASKDIMNNNDKWNYCVIEELKCNPREAREVKAHHMDHYRKLGFEIVNKQTPTGIDKV